MSVENFSLDIETLASRGPSVLLSIGLYHMQDFIEEEPDPNRLFVVNIDIDSCLKAGLTVSGSNIRWWLGQDNEARHALFVPEPQPLITAIGMLGGWYENRRSLDSKIPNRIWSHSTFDIPRIDDACNAVELEMPWSYRNCRDIRTIVDGIQEQLTERKRGHPLEHTCGWDAFAQGQQVLQALKIKKYDAVNRRIRGHSERLPS